MSDIMSIANILLKIAVARVNHKKDSFVKDGLTRSYASRGIRDLHDMQTRVYALYSLIKKGGNRSQVIALDPTIYQAVADKIQKNRTNVFALAYNRAQAKGGRQADRLMRDALSKKKHLDDWYNEVMAVKAAATNKLPSIKTVVSKKDKNTGVSHDEPLLNPRPAESRDPIQLSYYDKHGMAQVDRAIAPINRVILRMEDLAVLVEDLRVYTEFISGLAPRAKKARKAIEGYRANSPLDGKSYYRPVVVAKDNLVAALNSIADFDINLNLVLERIQTVTGSGKIDPAVKAAMFELARDLSANTSRVIRTNYPGSASILNDQSGSVIVSDATFQQILQVLGSQALAGSTTAANTYRELVNRANAAPVKPPKPGQAAKVNKVITTPGHKNDLQSNIKQISSRLSNALPLGSSVPASSDQFNRVILGYTELRRIQLRAQEDNESLRLAAIRARERGLNWSEADIRAERAKKSAKRSPQSNGLYASNRGLKKSDLQTIVVTIGAVYGATKKTEKLVQ